METYDFDPIATSWKTTSKFDQEFNKTFFLIFYNMCTCALCSIMKLYNFSHTLRSIPNIFNIDDIQTRGCTCYDITNILMIIHTRSEDGSKKFICMTCN